VATTLRTSLTLRDNGERRVDPADRIIADPDPRPYFEERQMGALVTKAWSCGPNGNSSPQQGKEKVDVFREFDGSKGRSIRVAEADPSGVVLGLMRGDD
jgi:hypothetical protein